MPTRHLLPLVLALVACGSSQPAPVDSTPEPHTASAHLTIRVFPTQGSSPIPAKGTVTSAADASRATVDTRPTPAEGCRLQLTPGEHTIAITHRFDSDGREHPVTGSRRIYLEPDAWDTVDVVVDVQPDD